MKYVAILMLTALPLLTLVGQEAKTVQEPEYIGTVVYLDPAGTLTPLEKQQPNTQTKVIGLGYGGAKTSIIFNGPASPVRFKAGQDIQFVVRLNAPGIDPETLVNLNVLKVTKGRREVVIAKAGSMGMNARSTSGESLRSLNFSKYGENSLKLSPATPLEPGEYVITTKFGQSAFLFGIDPK
jgi:hypothetical protein